MSSFTKFIAIMVILFIFAFIAIDYVAFRGGILLGPLTGGAAVKILDGLWPLFTGESGAYLTFIVVCIFIGLIAIGYKVIKG